MRTNFRRLRLYTQKPSKISARTKFRLKQKNIRLTDTLNLRYYYSNKPYIQRRLQKINGHTVQKVLESLHSVRGNRKITPYKLQDLFYDLSKSLTLERD
jgi:hypothetical protein